MGRMWDEKLQVNKTSFLNNYIHIKNAKPDTYMQSNKTLQHRRPVLHLRVEFSKTLLAGFFVVDFSNKRSSLAETHFRRLKKWHKMDCLVILFKQYALLTGFGREEKNEVNSFIAVFTPFLVFQRVSPHILDAQVALV